MAPLLFLLFLLSEAASESVVKVEQVGQDATLPCDTGDTSIRVAEWTRSDMSPPTEILFWRGGKTYSDFKDRVQLVDGELKTGNVSLTLKNVSREDVGTYECRVVTAGSRRNKRANIKTDPISIVKLQLADPEDNKGYNKDGHKGDTDNRNSTHLYGGLAAAAVGVFLLVPAAVGLFLFRKYKRPREKKPEPSAAEETGDNLL